MTGPIPAPDSQGPQLTSPPWGELSAARILASTGPGRPGSGVMGPSPFEENKSKLQLLHEDKRREYLYQLQEFVVTDNNRNWRFPYELAEQLILILELHNPNYVYDHLMHIALKLCADKVSEVVAILQKFCSNSGSALGFSFIVNSSHGSGTVLSGSEAYFRNAGNPHLGVSEETVLALLSDQNQDLTFFAALEPKRGNVTDPRHAARTELTHL